MNDAPGDREDVPDLGGERACWLDEVCNSCGAVGGHRPGCEFTEPDDEMVTQEFDTRISTPASPPSTSPEDSDGRYSPR